MRIFHNLNVDYMKKRKIFYIISLVIFLAGMLSIIIRGLEFGIDFKGGTEIVLQFEKPIDIKIIRDKLSNIGLGDLEVKTFGKETGVLVRTELQVLPSNLIPKIKNEIENAINQTLPNIPYKIIDSSSSTFTYGFPNPDTANIMIDKLFALGFQTGRVSQDLSNTNMLIRVGISDWIKDNLKESIKENSFKILREEKVGPKVGSELKTDALIAIVLSLVGILIYLAFRFKFIFALGAVVALFHDVLITLGLYALLYGLIPGLNLEINLTVVGAFLTLIGYSVNDTVIVFDRVRETIKVNKTGKLSDMMNMAVNKTMSRTILTGGTTLISCIVLLIFGGEVIKAFSFTLTFGIITGTYSSVFVASALVLDYAEKYQKKVEF